MLNSTILHSGFYITMRAQDNATLYYESITSLWCFIYRKLIGVLKDLNVMDGYGRICYDYEECIDILRERFDLSADDPRYQDLNSVLYQGIIVSDRYALPDWVKVYPGVVAGLCINEFSEDLKNGRIRFLSNFTPESREITIPIRWIKRGAKSMDIFYDNESGHYTIEIIFDNQFGNSVKLVILSNTQRMDTFIDSNIIKTMTEDEADELSDRLSIMIVSAPELRAAHKLACTLSILPAKEEETL